MVESEPSRAGSRPVQVYKEASEASSDQGASQSAKAVEPISGRTRVRKLVGTSGGSELYLQEVSVAGDSVVKWMDLKANTRQIAAALRGSEAFLTAEGLSRLQVHLPQVSDRSALRWGRVLSALMDNPKLTSISITGLTLDEASLIVVAAPIPECKRFFVSRKKGLRVTLYPVSSAREDTYAMGLSKTAWSPQPGDPADEEVEEVDESDEDEDPAVPASAASSR